MSLNIKSAEAERLARELAAATGESLTGAVTVALRERLDRLSGRRREEVAARAALIRKISRDAAGRWAEAYERGDHGDLLYNAGGPFVTSGRGAGTPRD